MADTTHPLNSPNPLFLNNFISETAYPWDSFLAQIQTPGEYQIVFASNIENYLSHHPNYPCKSLNDLVIFYDHMDGEFTIYESFDFYKLTNTQTIYTQYQGAQWDILIFKNIDPLFKPNLPPVRWANNLNNPNNLDPLDPIEILIQNNPTPAQQFYIGSSKNNQNLNQTKPTEPSPPDQSKELQTVQLKPTWRKISQKPNTLSDWLNSLSPDISTWILKLFIYTPSDLNKKLDPIDSIGLIEISKNILDDFLVQKDHALSKNFTSPHSYISFWNPFLDWLQSIELETFLSFAKNIQNTQIPYSHLSISLQNKIHNQTLTSQNIKAIFKWLRQIIDLLIQYQFSPNCLHHLNPGFIYIFTKPHLHSNSKPYSLYKIYKTTDNQGLIKEIDWVNQLNQLNNQSNNPLNNQFLGPYQNHIDIPYQLTQNRKIIHHYSSIIFYSPFKLSWERILFYGQINLSKNPLHSPLNSSAQNYIQSLQKEIPPHPNQLIQRANLTLHPDKLEPIFNQQYLNKNNKNNLNFKLTPQSTLNFSKDPSLWYKNSIIWINNQYLPNLFLNDPIHIIAQNHYLILQCESELESIVNQSHQNPNMQSAALAYKTFFSPNGIKNNSILSLPESLQTESKIYQTLEKTRKTASKAKLLKALEHSKRKYIKKYITLFQKNTLYYLNNLNNLNFLDINLIITDRFATSDPKDYLSAFNWFQGLWGFTCRDPSHIDRCLAIEPTPVAEAVLLNKSAEISLALGVTTVELPFFKPKWRITRYNRINYELFKTDYIIDTSKPDPSPKLDQTSLFKTLPKPPGYTYLKAIQNPSHPLYSIIWLRHSNHIHPTQQYAKGHYTRTQFQKTIQLLNQKTQHNHFLLQEDALDTQDIHTHFKHLLHAVLEQFGVYLDNLVIHLQKLYGQDFYKSNPKTIHQILNLYSDWAELKPNSLYLGTHGKKLASEYIQFGQEKFFTQRAQNIEKYLNKNQNSLNNILFYAENSEGKVNYILPDKALKYCDPNNRSQNNLNQNKFNQKKFNQKKLAIRTHQNLIHTRIILSVGLLSLCWGEVSDQIKLMNQNPDVYTIAAFAANFSLACVELSDCIEHLKQSNALAARLLSKSFKLSKIEYGLKFFKKGVLPEFSGVISSLDSINQAILDWEQGAINHDPALITAGILNCISSASAIASITSAFFNSTSEKIITSAESTELSELSEKIAFMDAIGLDLFGWIALLSTASAFFVSLFEHNIYQNWLYESGFSINKTSKKLPPNIAYLALLEILIQPDFQLNLNKNSISYRAFCPFAQHLPKPNLHIQPLLSHSPFLYNPKEHKTITLAAPIASETKQLVSINAQTTMGTYALGQLQPTYSAFTNQFNHLIHHSLSNLYNSAQDYHFVLTALSYLSFENIFQKNAQNKSNKSNKFNKFQIIPNNVLKQTHIENLSHTQKNPTTPFQAGGQYWVAPLTPISDDNIPEKYLYRATNLLTEPLMNNINFDHLIFFTSQNHHSTIHRAPPLHSHHSHHLNLIEFEKSVDPSKVRLITEDALSLSKFVGDIANPLHIAKFYFHQADFICKSINK